MRKLEKLGYEQVELEVLESNENATYLYKKLGFKECGRIPNGIKLKNGNYSEKKEGHLAFICFHTNSCIIYSHY